MEKRKLGLWSATFLGISTILGSGWLFAPYKAAEAAGPASIFSWIIGAIIVGFLAMCFTEIAALYPKRGVTAIIPTLSHNKFFGFPFAIANWLGIIAVVALEATATVQYLIHLVPASSHLFFHHNTLSLYGTLLTLALIFLFMLINYWGAGFLTKTNNILSIVKLIVPVITALMILGVSFHKQNFITEQHNIAPYGIKSIFTAILTSGIIVAFNGFQTVIAFANDIKKPHKTIPRSVLIALGSCLVIYLLLQVAFIGGMPTDKLTHGWQSLNLYAPMVQLPLFLGLGVLTSIIYFGATVAPCGSGIAFIGTASRMFTAMSRNHQMPKYFDHIHKQHGLSRRSLICNTLIAMGFLLLFRSWAQLAEILSLFHIISYLPTPIALVVFRKQIRANKHPFLLPFGRPIALAVFTLFTLLFSMADFALAFKLFVMLAIFQAIFLVLDSRSIVNILIGIKKCLTLFFFFVILLFLIWASPTNARLMPTAYFDCVTVVFSIVFFFILTKTEKTNAELLNSNVNLFRNGRKD